MPVRAAILEEILRRPEAQQGIADIRAGRWSEIASDYGAIFYELGRRYAVTGGGTDAPRHQFELIQKTLVDADVAQILQEIIG